MQDHHKVFENYLIKNNLLYTTQRKKVVDAVFAIHDHFEIEEFLGYLRENKIKIARATVYSTIKLLLESRLIRKIRLPHNGVAYEHTFGHDHHDHIICLDCNHVLEVHDDIIEDQQDALCEEHGFKLENHVHTMYVRCKKFHSEGRCEHKKELV